ncbi:MAG: insulinase family protein, partial [Clostridia bacterium]|nr:insulinase family protein [Clostridia bacterium]
AYYAQSVLEKYKGLMIIMSGIDADKRAQAEEIILKQLEEIKRGVISEHEMNATQSSLETGLKSMQDSQGSIVDFFMSQHITESGEDFESMREGIKKVTVDDVIRVAQNIELDTVYFLKPDGRSTGEEGQA